MENTEVLWAQANTKQHAERQVINIVSSDLLLTQSEKAVLLGESSIQSIQTQLCEEQGHKCIKV